MNVQDDFLNNAVDSTKVHNVFLINGIRLVGTIQGHDQYVLSLVGNSGIVQMVYKHAVSTIAMV